MKRVSNALLVASIALVAVALATLLAVAWADSAVSGAVTSLVVGFFGLLAGPALKDFID